MVKKASYITSNIESQTISDYTCKTNYDCHDKGYCHVGACKCLANYEYKVDCSSYGCKYLPWK